MADKLEGALEESFKNLPYTKRLKDNGPWELKRLDDGSLELVGKNRRIHYERAIELNRPLPRLRALHKRKHILKIGIEITK